MSWLRCVSYLSPSLPPELFATVAEYLASSLSGTSVSMEYEARFSAPLAAESDPFASGQADLGFACSTAVARSYEPDAGFELLGCAPLFDDPRAQGRPVYFSDVVVRRESAFGRLEDLEGCVWAYNDGCSLSGLYCLLQFLRREGSGLDFLGGLRQSGSHLRSIELVLADGVDAAAIDSNVLALQWERRPELRTDLRVIGSWGPFPVQPVIARRTLPQPTKVAVREALVALSGVPQWRARFAGFKLVGFAQVDEAFYAEERREIEACQREFGKLTPTKAIERVENSI